MDGPTDPSYLSANRGPKIITAVSTCIALSAIAVILRLYTRLVIVRNAGVDDVLTGFAWLAAAGMTAFMIEEAKSGTGRHISTLSLEEIRETLRSLYISIPLYRLAIALVQSSIAVQFLRIFSANLWIRRVCLTFLVLINGFNLATIVASIFICSPIKGFWDIRVKNTKCINQSALWYSIAIYCVLIDVALVIMPIPVFKSLQLPKRQKMAFILIFAVGLLACITSMIRLHSLYLLLKSKDPTWDNTDTTIWTNAETNVYIICACIPTLQPFFVHFFPRLLHPTSSRTRTSHQDTTFVDDAELLDHTVVNAGTCSEASVPEGSHPTKIK